MSDPCRNIKPACAQNGGAHVLGLAKCNRQTKRRLRSSILSIGDQDLQWRRIPREYQDIHLPLVDLEKTTPNTSSPLMDLGITYLVTCFPSCLWILWYYLYGLPREWICDWDLLSSVLPCVHLPPPPSYERLGHLGSLPYINFASLHP